MSRYSYTDEEFIEAVQNSVRLVATECILSGLLVFSKRYIPIRARIGSDS